MRLDAADHDADEYRLIGNSIDHLIVKNSSPWKLNTRIRSSVKSKLEAAATANRVRYSGARNRLVSGHRLQSADTRNQGPAPGRRGASPTGGGSLEIMRADAASHSITDSGSGRLRRRIQARR